MRVKGSHFIGIASPAGSDEEARSRLERLRSDFPNASHYCWASVLRGTGGEVERTNDAGEPAGTAGLPILQAIRQAELANVLVAVVRYFGGTKLGKGGLARAYRDAARGCLEGARRIEQVPMVSLRIVGPLERDGEMRHLVARRGGRLTRASYEADGVVTLEIALPTAEENMLRDDLSTLTRGACRFEVLRAG